MAMSLSHTLPIRCIILAIPLCVGTGPLQIEWLDTILPSLTDLLIRTLHQQHHPQTLSACSFSHTIVKTMNLFRFSCTTFSVTSCHISKTKTADGHSYRRVYLKSVHIISHGISHPPFLSHYNINLHSFVRGLPLFAIYQPRLSYFYCSFPVLPQFDTCNDVPSVLKYI